MASPQPTQGCAGGTRRTGGSGGCSVRQCAATASCRRGDSAGATESGGCRAPSGPSPCERGWPGGACAREDGGWGCAVSQKAVLAMLAGAKILGRLSRVSSSRR